MDQMTKHRVHRYRVGRRHDDIHRFGAAGSRAISLHSCHAIHYMEPGLHKIVQIRRHLGKHFRRSEPGMGSTFVDTEDTAESVLDCPCYPFQLMSLHLTDIYHRVSVYYLTHCFRSYLNAEFFSVLFKRVHNGKTLFVAERVTDAVKGKGENGIQGVLKDPVPHIQLCVVRNYLGPF